MQQALHNAWPYVRIPLSIIACVHLLALALLPGGRNVLFDVRATDVPGYLSWFQVPDTLGFYTTHGKDGYLIYKIYTQDGAVVEGAFPDTGVSPRLRYDRWASAGDAASGPYPPLHAYVARYVVDQLPSPPLRIELYAAHHRWDRNALRYPWPGDELETTLGLRRLGTYNGLTRTWEPVAREGRRL